MTSDEKKTRRRVNKILSTQWVNEFFVIEIEMADGSRETISLTPGKALELLNAWTESE